MASAGLIAALLVLLVWRLTHMPHSPKVGASAPGFNLSLVTDSSHRLALGALRGHPVVVNFWQSSCVPCEAEAGALETLYRRYRGQGLVVVGIDYRDFASDARNFVRHHGETFPTVRDPSGSVADAYGITGTPETFFIDRRGRIVGDHVLGSISAPGNTTLVEASLRAVLGA